MKKIIITILATIFVIGFLEVGLGYYLLRQIPAGMVIADYIAADTEKISKEADKIVIGKVVEVLPGKESKDFDGRLTVATDVTIEVSSTLKGAPEKL